MSTYDNVYNIFGFITKLGSEFETSANIFINTFKDVIGETNIKQEIVHFSSCIMQIN